MFVRTAAGSEGYVQVRYVVPAASSDSSCVLPVAPVQNSKQNPVSENAPASPHLDSALAQATLYPHIGEWRAVHELPEPGRYSTSGERLGDISMYTFTPAFSRMLSAAEFNHHRRYCCKPDAVGFEGVECFHLFRGSEAVFEKNHWSCCGSSVRNGTCTHPPVGPHSMNACKLGVQCRRCRR